jgi:hypothetical protein
MANGMKLNLPWHLRHVAGDIAEETPLRVWRHEAEQVGLKRGAEPLRMLVANREW